MVAWVHNLLCSNRSRTLPGSIAGRDGGGLAEALRTNPQQFGMSKEKNRKAAAGLGGGSFLCMMALFVFGKLLHLV